MVLYAVRLPRSRRILSALGVAAGFVIVSGAVLSSQAPHIDTPVVASGATGRSVGGPGPAAGPISPRSYARPASAKTVVEAPPATGAPGLRVVATPQGRTLRMTETATFATAQASVVLTPPSLGGAGAQFDGLRPVVREVKVSIDGKPYMTLGNLTGRRTIQLPSGVRSVEVTYVLSNVFSPTSGTTDRVTAFEPLMSSPREPLPVSYTVGGGASTASIVCPELPIFNQGCGGTAGVLSGLPSDQSLIVLTLGAPPLTLDPAPTVTQAPGGGSVPGTPAPSTPSSTPPAPDPVAPVTTPPTTPPTDPAASQPPVVPPASPPPTDTPAPTSTPDPVSPTTTPPTNPAPSDPPPTTDAPPSASPPPPTDTPTVAPTTTPPIGTEKMPNVAQGAPIGTELRVQPTSTATPNATPIATVTPQPPATSTLSSTSTVGP